MPKIDGNLDAQVQVRTTTRNNIGEAVKGWATVQTIHGWLDYSGGGSGYTSFDAKIQETTHIFICDYVALEATITNENSRLVINDEVYDILLIDNPMNLNKQLEIYMKYTGGQDG